MRAMGQCLYRAHQLHAIIGRLFITAVQILCTSITKNEMCAPATSARIAFTGTIRIGHGGV